MGWAKYVASLKNHFPLITLIITLTVVVVMMAFLAFEIRAAFAGLGDVMGSFFERTIRVDSKAEASP